MKVNQIVGEHKKGMRAKIYARKPKTGPEPRKAVEPNKEAGVDEAVLQQIKPGISAQIKDPEKGITYDIDLSKPEMAAALTPDEKGGLQFDPTPQPAGAQLAAPGATGPQPGQEVVIKTDEEQDDLGPIGGDPTDDFIDDVVDHDFERSARGEPHARELDAMLRIAGLR